MIEQPNLTPVIESKESSEAEQLRAIESLPWEADVKQDIALFILGRKPAVNIGGYLNLNPEDELKNEEVKRNFEALKNMCGRFGFHFNIQSFDYVENVKRISMLISHDRETLNKAVDAESGGDEKTLGLLMGYPQSAVDAYGTNQAFIWEDELAQAEKEKLIAENLLPFLQFMPSKGHREEEFDWARTNRDLIKQKAPKLFGEIVGEYQKNLFDQKRKELEEITDALGKKIEPLILDSCVVFNVSGFNTSNSCEGHGEKGSTHSPWPFVSIEAPNEPEEYFVGETESFQKECKRRGADFDEPYHGLPEDVYWGIKRRLSEGEETEEYKEWQKKNRELVQKITALIRQFYESRDSVADHVRIKEPNKGGIFDVSSASEEEKRKYIQGKMDEKSREESVAFLLERRKEMMAFTDWLKKKYLLGEV